MPVPASYNDITQDIKLRDHIGWVWYEREVHVPAGWAGQRVVLHFGSATHEAVVWVNGIEVVRHEGGYLPFQADVTDHATPGGTFRLTVAVNNILTWATIPPGELHERGRHPNYPHV